MNTRLTGLSAIGYGIEDYISMFDLSDFELDMKILNCYASVSAFAADMTKRKLRVVACDPLYQTPIPEIKALAEKAQIKLLEEIEYHSDRYALPPNEAKQQVSDHQQGVIRFLEDLPLGLKEGRYTFDGLPSLSFKTEQFDLALVCHYLFTNSDKLSVDFHVKAIQELSRVANEVRIFPLVTHTGSLSLHVGEVASMLQTLGLGVEIRGVQFKFQKQDNAMMRIWSSSCTVAAHASS